MAIDTPGGNLNFLSFLRKCKCHGVVPQSLNFKVTNRRLKYSVAYLHANVSYLMKKYCLVILWLY